MRSRYATLLCFPFFLSVWLGTLLSRPAYAEAPVAWDMKTQGRYVTSVCRDLQHRLWVGTEDGQGLWAYNPASKAWTHFPASSDLSGDIYALACDKAGRIWAGGLSGVSVYNGQQWRQYGPTDGPLGTRLFALAVSPKDGGVWGATEAGLFRYANSRWTYFTRANGLPSDQAQALAFAPDGTLYVGTQCDGVAVGSPDDNYKTWRTTPGPQTLPNTPIGRGLPSGLINCLLVAKDGTAYAGTTGGLAKSRDGGDTWHYTRGLDWKNKLAGLYRPVAPQSVPYSGDLMREDDVTALAEDTSGGLWIGHSQGSVEVFDPKTGKRVQSGADAAVPNDYISELFVEGRAAWVALYGGGLLTPFAESVPAFAPVAEMPAPPLPVPAAPPALAELKAMTARVKALTGEMPVGGGTFLGQDWRTLGDWVGRYGRQYAVLCAVASPMDQVLTWDTHYAVDGQIGPHRAPQGDALRHWIQPDMIRTSRLGTLYSPVDGFRTQAEWDDHGETYPRTFEGPDLWVSVTVPEGVHRLSLYETNKDGHNDDNRLRDYRVDLLPYRAKLADALDLPPLAHARIHDFWNGVYTSFLVRGPSQYYVHIAKNNSHNTLLSGLFLDKLTGPATRFDKVPMAFMGIIHFDPPDLTRQPLPAVVSPELASAQSLWSALDAAQSQQNGAFLLTPYRSLALRSAKSSGGSEALLANWRWNLNFWVDDDHQTFLNYMHAAHGTLHGSLRGPINQ